MVNICKIMGVFRAERSQQKKAEVQPIVPSFKEDHPFSLVKNRSTLPPGAFLKSLPLVIAPEQRLTLDAIRVVSDLAANAYVQLVNAALETASDHDGGANATIVQCAWSFVDQMYAMRNLLKELGEAASGPKVDAFMEASKEASDLRNRTDHLHARIAGIAKKKGAEKSLFGSVSYCLDPKLAGHVDGDILMVTHHIEPIRPGETVGRTRAPGNNAGLPAGNFLISAGGYVLDIDLCIRKLSDLMIGINSGVESATQDLIERLSQETHRTKEELSVSYGMGVRMNYLLRKPTDAEFAEISQSHQ